jgi:hypothetical protein
MFRAFTALITAVLALLVPQAPAQAAAVGTYHHGYHTVYIESHAPSFPIQWAVEQVRLMHPDVDVHYGACRSGAGCAKVYQAHRGGAGWPSATYYKWYSGTTRLFEPVKTYFDLDWSHWTWHHRYQAACHEVLRDLGFEGRRYSLSSCTYQYLDNRASIRPDRWDISNLNSVY